METINTNLSDYTIDELFALFDIKINQQTDYESLTKQIKINGEKMISIFKDKNSDMSHFFEKTMNYLLKNKENETIKNSVIF